MQRFIQKQKNIMKLGQKIPYLGIFGMEFNKSYYQIFNQYSRICETTKFQSKQKKLRTNNTLLRLWAGMFKSYCHICNQRPPICLIAKFRAKIRILKFRTKNALFGCFGEKFWKAVVFFVFAGPSNLSYSKVWCRDKNP